MEFSVIDVETTGFSRTKDRIIEIAVIRIDDSGEVRDSFESLVNPCRDVGASHIHGLTASCLNKAPLFQDITGSIIDTINNSVVVSHNKNFDLGFLNSEFQRANARVPEVKGICTLQLSKYLFPELPSRKLEVLCEYLDILVENAHEAYSDCMATMLLFQKMRESYFMDYGEQDFINSIVGNSLFSTFSIKQIKKIQFKRSDAEEAIKRDESRMQNLLRRVPDYYKVEESNVSEYLNLLDAVLEDRIITEEEYSEIEKFASAFKIGSKKLTNIHEEYFRRLVRFYLADNVLSQSELLDLDKVANLLQIEPGKRKMIIELEKAELSFIQPDELGCDDSFSGKTVCFTGQLISKMHGALITRELANALALEKGLIVKKGVTKTLDMLVVADPNTQSGKGKKARQYGIKIIAEPVFWRQIGVNVE